MTYKHRIRPSRLQVLFLRGCIWGYKAIQTVLGLLVVLGVVLAVLGIISQKNGVSFKEGYSECSADFLNAIYEQDNTFIGEVAIHTMNGRDNRLAYVTPLKDWRNE